MNRRLFFPAVKRVCLSSGLSKTDVANSLMKVVWGEEDHPSFSYLLRRGGTRKNTAWKERDQTRLDGQDTTIHYNPRRSNVIVSVFRASEYTRMHLRACHRRPVDGDSRPHWADSESTSLGTRV